jgi:hypothetical protein
MVMSRDQNEGRSHNIKIENSFFKSVDRSNILEQLTVLSLGTFAIIRCRNFFLPVCYTKTQSLRYTQLKICLLFGMGV